MKNQWNKKRKRLNIQEAEVEKKIKKKIEKEARVKKEKDQEEDQFLMKRYRQIRFIREEF